MAKTPKQGRLPAPGFEKLYYSIGEVASMLDVNPSLIRYWEEQFDILSPKRNNKGNRLYTKMDVERLELIHHLLKNKGFTLKGAREALKKDAAHHAREQAFVRHLQKIREDLLSLRDQLEEDNPEGDQ